MSGIFIVLLFMLLYSFMGFLAGYFSYEKLNKEKVLSEEEKKKWKKGLIIAAIVIFVMFVIFAVIDVSGLFLPKPIHYDIPPYNPNIRLAMVR